MTVDAEAVTRAAVDLPDRFARKMRAEDTAVEGALDGQSRLRSSLDGVAGTAAQQRELLAGRSSGTATDHATGTARALEDEVRALLEESTRIENAVAEAAETLRLGRVGGGPHAGRSRLRATAGRCR